MKPTDDELDLLLKRLHLANARRIWRALVVRAEKDEWSYRDFLEVLVTEEIAQRQQTRLGRLSRRARFPFLKTIDDFDFTYQSTVRLSLLGSALSPDFITEGRLLDPLGQARPRKDPSRRCRRLPRDPERIRCPFCHRRGTHR
jgi:DNA replication protein DnaC